MINPPGVVTSSDHNLLKPAPTGESSNETAWFRTIVEHQDINIQKRRHDG
jgi:hypothetical protein